MTVARSTLVDASLTRWYHVVVRCARGANLLGEGHSDRKEWFENRLQALSQIFAMSVGGFAVADNQMHLLLRLEPAIARRWSAREVARRWGRLVPPRDRLRLQLPVSEDWIKEHAKDDEWVEATRERLQSLGWFMKSLTEPLARLANRQEKTRGSFFEGRYKNVAVLDEESLLGSIVYIDLNLMAPGSAGGPETRPYTSLHTRAKHVKALGRTRDLKAAKHKGDHATSATAALEESLWLCPIENRARRGSSCEGMFVGLPLGSYLRLVEFTDRLCRNGNAPVSREVSEILERVSTNLENWKARMETLMRGRLLGRVFAASRERLQEAAEKLGMERLPNLGGCPTH